MSEDAGQSGGGANSGSAGSLLAILAVLGTLLFGHDAPFRDYRPDSGNSQLAGVVPEQDIDARLWQDPLNTATDAAYKKEGTPSCGTPAKEIPQQMSIEKRTDPLNSLPRIKVLFVMVPDGPYSEAEEQRRRTREAVVAGLATSKFNPRAADKIGCWTTSINGKRTRIPFEWFDIAPEASNKTTTATLILWIADDGASKDFVSDIKNMMETIVTQVDATPDELAIGFDVIGPWYSKTIKKSLANLRRRQDISIEQKSKSQLYNLRIFSYGATVDNNYLITDMKLSIKNIWENPFKNESGSIHIYRPVPTDHLLAESIAEELRRRELLDREEPNCNNVLYVGEYDSLYGRSLAETMEKALHCKIGAAFRYNYLRGLDGIVPKEKTETSTKTDTPAPQTSPQSKPVKETLERAEGQSQFDYLRRLAARIKEDATSASVKVIGILGSDVYDKVLLLQALRREFPNATFFTTDLDARLLEPRYLEWTRNLLIVSGFDLQLSSELQDTIPPFRGTYQTAAYFSTLLAMGMVPAEKVKLDTSVEKWTDARNMTPRLFEVGNTKLVRLSESTPSSSPACHIPSGAASKQNAALPLNPDIACPYPYMKTGPHYFLDALMWLILIMLSAAIAHRRERRSQNESESLLFFVTRYSWRRNILIVAFDLLAAIVIVEVTFQYIWPAIAKWITGDFDGEHIWPIDGTNLWPVVLFRGLSILIEILFIRAILRHDERNLRFINKQLPLGGKNGGSTAREGRPQEGDKRFGALSDHVRGALKELKFAVASMFTYSAAKKSKDEDGRETYKVTVSENWRIYKELHEKHVLKWRAVVLSSIFTLVSFLVFKTIDMQDPPHRGALVNNFHLWVALIDWWVMLVLVALVADLAIRASCFIIDLHRKRVDWPRKVASNADDYRLAAEHIRDMCAIDFAGLRSGAVSGYVWYVGAVMLIHALLATKMVSNQAFPLAVIIAAGVCLVLVMIVMISLHYIVEPLRRDVIRRLSDALLKAKGDMATDSETADKPGPMVKSNAAQLEYLVDYVKNYRTGAFVPMWRQPFVGAIALPSAAIWAPAIARYLTSLGN